MLEQETGIWWISCLGELRCAYAQVGLDRCPTWRLGESLGVLSWSPCCRASRLRLLYQELSDARHRVPILTSLRSLFFLHKKTSEVDGWFSNSTMTELWVGISVILFLPSLTLPFVVTQGRLQEFQKCVITRMLPGQERSGRTFLASRLFIREETLSQNPPSRFSLTSLWPVLGPLPTLNQL